MSTGDKLGQEAQGIFKAVGDLGEELKNNINAFADKAGEGVSGSKSSSSSSSSGVSSDAQKAGDEIKKGVDSAGKKVDEVIQQNKK